MKTIYYVPWLKITIANIITVILVFTDSGANEPANQP